MQRTASASKQERGRGRGRPLPRCPGRGLRRAASPLTGADRVQESGVVGHRHQRHPALRHQPLFQPLHVGGVEVVGLGEGGGGVLLDALASRPVCGPSCSCVFSCLGARAVGTPPTKAPQCGSQSQPAPTAPNPQDPSSRSQRPNCSGSRHRRARRKAPKQPKPVPRSEGALNPPRAHRLVQQQDVGSEQHGAACARGRGRAGGVGWLIPGGREGWVAGRAFGGRKGVPGGVLPALQPGLGCESPVTTCHGFCPGFRATSEGCRRVRRPAAEPRSHTRATRRTA